MSNKSLVLGKNTFTQKNFEIPAARLATKKIGIVGVSGCGKTATSALIVEQMIESGIVPVIFDPVGRWFDLGLSADGKGRGLPIAIIGGQHGQIELTPDMGASIARYVAEMRVPTVVDLSQMSSKSHWRQIVQDFGNKIFEINRAPVHLVVEESPEFIPQRVNESVAGVYGAMDKIIRIGRNKGIGVTLIAQRPQMINKDSLSQVNALVVMRLTDPGSIDTAHDWLQAQGADSEVTDRFIDALPTFADGQGLILSPAWLRTFESVQFNRRKTFHYDPEADVTDDVSDSAIAQAVDTDKLRKMFERYVEPKSTPSTKAAKVDAALVNRVTKLQEENERLQQALDAQQTASISEDDIQNRIRAAVYEREALLSRALGALGAIKEQADTALGAQPTNPLVGNMASVNKVAALVQRASENRDRTERKILETMGNLYPQFPDGITITQIAVEAGYSVNGGSFNQTIRQLVKRRVVVRVGNGVVNFNPDLLR